MEGKDCHCMHLAYAGRGAHLLIIIIITITITIIIIIIIMLGGLALTEAVHDGTPDTDRLPLKVQ